MEIRPKKIPKFLFGGIYNENNPFLIASINPDLNATPLSTIYQVPLWYLNDYKYHSLRGWNNKLNQSQATDKLKNHYNAGDLNTAFYKNYAYTQTPEVVGLDILSFYDSDGKGMSAVDFMNFYNLNADKIRGYWNRNQTYNNVGSSSTYNHNTLYRAMFKNRSTTGSQLNSDYDIGYLENILSKNGSSTWLRRMDTYEKEFDINNPDMSRVHSIKLSDGTTANYYKLRNGNIGLLDLKDLINSLKFNPDLNEDDGSITRSPKEATKSPVGDYNGSPASLLTLILLLPQSVDEKVDPTGGAQKTGKYNSKNWFGSLDWGKLGNTLLKSLPNIIEDVRLANSLINNDRIYKAALEGIRPNLLQTYNTYRQVVGDEATKLAYYRRGAEGVSRASRAFTSDADRLMAYMMEANRQANELQAQGDIADNQEIRRTSDEAMQHAWNNTQRRTQVANENIAQMNAAKLAKQNLLAEKYAANYTSWDNFLKARETRMRDKIEYNKSLEDLINMMEAQSQMEDELRPFLLNYQAALEKSKDANELYNHNDPEVQRTLAELRAKERELTIRLYRQKLNNNSLFWAKSGTKLAYRSSDDLLYKSTRDAVEHFRKMTKMTDDSYHKSRKKTSKLVSHPKPKKMQQGGVAPFVVFTPTVTGGERSAAAYSTVASGSSSSSSKEDKDKNLLKLVLDLFSKVEGLPSDMNAVYVPMMNLLNRVRAGGPEITNQEIATLYTLGMYQMSQLKYNQLQYNLILQNLINNDAMNEYAIMPGNKVVAQNIDTGEVKAIDYMDIPDNYAPLTNYQLMQLRAYDRSFDKFSLLATSRGVGMNKITEQIKNLIGTVGETELENQGFTKKEAGNIAAGLAILADAPDGVYKTDTLTKNQKQQMLAALLYVLRTLPENMKDVLKFHANMLGTDVSSLIGLRLMAEEDYTHKTTITPLTGKAASETNGSESSGSGATNSAALAFVMGQGPRKLIDFNVGTSLATRVLGIKGVLLNHSGENLGEGSTLLDVSKSQFGGFLQINKATFGGSRLNSGSGNQIILNGSEIVGMDLPYTTNLNKEEIPDFLMTKRMEDADEIIALEGITDYKEINKIYLDHLLPPKYDENGNLNKTNYKRFAAILVTLNENNLLNANGILADEIKIANKSERELYELSVLKSTGDKKFELSNSDFLWFGDGDVLYKGTLFIPYDEDIAFAALSSGHPLKLNIPNSVDKVQEMQYTSKIKNFKPQDITLSQLKNN